MFDSLQQFYCSDAWRNLRQQLIFERTSADGILYCEHSGKPLIKSYDIVAHHKTPLTMANVNDYTVSLNPDNIMLVSQQAHNEIHARFGYTTQRKVYYVYGAPCSGKTTFVNTVKGNSDLIFDSDNIWEAITGKRYEKPKALNEVFFAMRKNLTELIKFRTGRWEKAYYIEGGARKSDRDRMMKLLGAEPIFINTDKAECLKRLTNDRNRTDAQKAQWKIYINEWFEEYTE